MSFFVAVDIGCIECCEPTAVIGIFSTHAAAQCACDEREAFQQAHWTGQHAFEVHEVVTLDIAAKAGVK